MASEKYIKSAMVYAVDNIVILTIPSSNHNRC